VPESSRLPPDGKTPSRGSGRSGDWRESLAFIADISQKLAIPLLTVAATGLGIYLSHSANERANLARQREQEIAAEQNRLALRNQREQSETALRSTMFRELVGPLLQGGVGGRNDAAQAAQQLALLAELLTLNFHEHFELGPALRYVDKLPEQTAEARARLRGTARRVISRQLAPMITSVGANAGSEPAYVELSLQGDVDEPDAGSVEGRGPAATVLLPACRAVGTPDVRSGRVEMHCSRRPVTGNGAQVSTVPLEVTSPDGRDRVRIQLSSFNWNEQTVAVVATPLPPQESGAAPAMLNFPPQRIEFTVSSYSLPFSDNTLLPTGNRFGLYIRTVDDIPGVARIMNVWFVWFPRGFIPPRERPLDLDLEPVAPLAPAGALTPG
jgi:hypothetical protein